MANGVKHFWAERSWMSLPRYYAVGRSNLLLGVAILMVQDWYPHPTWCRSVDQVVTIVRLDVALQVENSFRR